MTDATYMIAPDAMASVHAALADANQRIAVLRTDAQRLTGMVDSLMRERNDLRAEVSDARGRVSHFQADAAQWRARYMAAHDVLLHVEDFCENFLAPEGTISMGRFFAMRAAFLAYRAAVEAGAPLGWAVAEEQLPDAEAQSYTEEGQGT